MLSIFIQRTILRMLVQVLPEKMMPKKVLDLNLRFSVDQQVAKSSTSRMKGKKYWLAAPPTVTCALTTNFYQKLNAILNALTTMIHSGQS